MYGVSASTLLPATAPGGMRQAGKLAYGVY